jgi:hypothetical protein
MVGPSSGTTTPIQWLVQLVSGGVLTISSARLEVEVFLRTTLPGLQVVSEQVWLDTGAPLSVIPFHVHKGRLNWKPVVGVKLAWAGQTCDLGTIDIWLPTEQSSSPRGPFPLLAKFPRSDPPGNPDPIGSRVLLIAAGGTNFAPRAASRRDSSALRTEASDTSPTLISQPAC